MRLIHVDSEAMAVENFKNYVKDKIDISCCSFFSTSSAALEYAKMNKVDIAFLDVDISDMSGIELAYELKRTNSRLLIIYVTRNMEYTKEAYQSGGIGYIEKPFSIEQMDEMFNILTAILCHGLGQEMNEGNKIFFKTFGRFDILLDDTPLVISSAKVKELLALLIDGRGETFTNVDVFNALWENKEYNSITSAYVRRVKTALKKLLEEIDARDLVVFERNSINLNMKLFEQGLCDCDYYRTMLGDRRYINEYNGYYMKQYSWAEETVFIIENKIKTLNKGL